MIENNNRDKAEKDFLDENKKNIRGEIVASFANAAKEGDIKTIGDILEGIRNIPDFFPQLLASDKIGLNPLHLAAANNHVGVVKKIIEAVKDNREILSSLLSATEMTPWQIAVQGNCFSVINQFLDFAENDMEFFKALIVSKEQKSFLSPPSNPLALLVVKGQSDLVSRFLNIAKADKDLIVDIFKPNQHGTTLLHTAAAWGHLKLVQILLDVGMNPQIKDEDGKTAADWLRDNIAKKKQNLDLENKPIKEKLDRLTKALEEVGLHIEGLDTAQPMPQAEALQRVSESLLDLRAEDLLLLAGFIGDKPQMTSAIKAGLELIKSNLLKSKEELENQDAKLKQEQQRLFGELETAVSSLEKAVSSTSIPAPAATAAVTNNVKVDLGQVKGRKEQIGI